MSMKLTTDRLIIREYKNKDYKRFFELTTKPNVYIPCGAQPLKNIKEAKHCIKLFIAAYKENFHILKYAICEKGNDELIGGITLTFTDDYIELGYWLEETYRNNGYMTEVIDRVINSYGGRTFKIKCFSTNRSSIAIANKFKFRFEKVENGVYEFILERGYTC